MIGNFQINIKWIVKKIEFTRKLQSFLIYRGFTHIYNLGIRPTSDANECREDFILIPLKPDDPRLTYEETDTVIEKINDNEVMDMADGDEFISFFVEIPESEYENFLNHL